MSTTCSWRLPVSSRRSLVRRRLSAHRRSSYLPPRATVSRAPWRCLPCRPRQRHDAGRSLDGCQVLPHRQLADLTAHRLADDRRCAVVDAAVDPRRRNLVGDRLEDYFPRPARERGGRTETNVPQIPDWCGCSTEYLPVPVGDGWWQLVPIWEPIRHRTRCASMNPRFRAVLIPRRMPGLARAARIGGSGSYRRRASRRRAHLSRPSRPWISGPALGVATHVEPKRCRHGSKRGQGATRRDLRMERNSPGSGPSRPCCCGH
jgi:hypothetical protein